MTNPALIPMPSLSRRKLISVFGYSILLNALGWVTTKSSDHVVSECTCYFPQERNMDEFASDSANWQDHRAIDAKIEHLRAAGLILSEDRQMKPRQSLWRMEFPNIAAFEKVRTELETAGKFDDATRRALGYRVDLTVKAGPKVLLNKRETV